MAQQSPSEPTANPLEEAREDSLEEVFLRMDEHTQARTLATPQGKEAVEALVEVFRKQRLIWEEAEARGAKRAPSAKKVQETTLADLGLD